MKSNRVIGTCMVAALSILTTACDPIYGVSRSAHVNTMPSPALVGEVICSTPGVAKVDYKRSEGGRPLTITGIHAPDQVYTFIYKGTNVWACMLFEVDWKGRVEFSQSLTRMRIPPPQQSVDATRPVMKEIEKGLEQRCGLYGLSTNVTEWCRGVKCN